MKVIFLSCRDARTHTSCPVLFREMVQSEDEVDNVQEDLFLALVMSYSSRSLDTV